MVERVLVPKAVLVKHEDFLGLLVSKYKFVIEHVLVEQEVGSDDFGVNFLQVFYVNSYPVDSTKHFGLMENYLFSVRKQLGMEAEVV